MFSAMKQNAFQQSPFCNCHQKTIRQNNEVFEKENFDQRVFEPFWACITQISIARQFEFTQSGNFYENKIIFENEYNFLTSNIDFKILIPFQF